MKTKSLKGGFCFVLQVLRPMSRCIPFPPPGYVWNGEGGEALIELIKVCLFEQFMFCYYCYIVTSHLELNGELLSFMACVYDEIVPFFNE